MHLRDPIGARSKLPKFDQFSKIFVSTSAQVEEIHSYVDQEAFYQNCKFHYPQGGDPVLRWGHFGHKVKIHYFFENLLYQWFSCKQTKYRIIMRTKTSTKVVNFMNSGEGNPVVGHGHWNASFLFCSLPLNIQTVR